jgi:quercetin dioxygenase-like cupin family protein
VVEGEVAIDSGRLAAGDVLIAARGASGTMRTTTRTEVLHFGAGSQGAGANGQLTAVGENPKLRAAPSDLAVKDRQTADTPLVSYYCDGSDDGCRMMIFRVASEKGYVGPSHTHSENEIIVVLTGALQVGRDRLAAGTAIGIPAHRRYRFSADASFSFVNYRSGPTTTVLRPGTVPIPDGPTR